MATPPVPKSPALCRRVLPRRGNIKARIVRLLIGLQLCFLQSFYLIWYFLSGGWLNKGRGNGGLSPDSEEEDNHVSSGNNEGRLDDDSGSNDVRLDGGIEEQQRRAGETPGPSTVISPTKKRKESTVTPRGTDGLDRCVRSVMQQGLWQAVDDLDNWERMFENFNLENDMRHTPSYSYQLNQITNNMHSGFRQLLQLRETNPELSSEDLKVYSVPICWPSKKRVDFWSDLSDELLSRAKAPNPPAELKKLMLELERTWQLHFGEKRIHIIDEGWITKFGKKWRLHFGGKWIDIIDEWWIKNFGKKWIDKIDGKWIEKIKLEYRPSKSDQTLCRGLLRFVRNRRHHLDEFQKSHGLRSVESFYNYLDALFPYLLMVSYGVAYRFCSEEPWFEEYR